jgi:alpha-2-macroglobulin
MSLASVDSTGLRCFCGMPRVAVWCLLALALAGCRRDGFSNKGVELVLSTDPPTPVTTFELRFEQPMVKSSRTGLPTENGPLVISPSLPGSFTWLTPHSGIFTPTEPLALDTTYHLALRPRLLGANGQPSGARLHRIVTTPPFSAVALSAKRRSTNACSLPDIRMIFNADLNPSQAEPFAYFQSADKRRIPALLRVAETEETWSWHDLGQEVSLRTWHEQWTERSDPGLSYGPRRYLGEETGAQSERPAQAGVGNLIVATPREALPVGKDWLLVLERGLPSLDGRLRLRARVQAPVGDITPFGVQSAVAVNTLKSGPAVVFEFSKTIPDYLTNQFGKWIEVVPAVPDLQATVTSRTLSLHGRFETRGTYAFRIRNGLPAAEPFTLATGTKFSLTIPTVKPRLYFPAFARDQLAAGRRSFPVLAVNVPKIRLRAKLLEPTSAIYALRTYEASYFRGWRSSEEGNAADEPYRFVDYELVPGHTIHDHIVDGTSELDKPVQVEIAWDRVLGPKSNGMVFLQAEQAENTSNTARLGAEGIIQVTDLGLVWKQSAGGMEVFVFSCETGRAKGATVRMYNHENVALGEARTDEAGIARLPWHKEATWVAAQLGNDFHFLRIHEPAGWLHAGMLPQTWGQPDAPRRVMLFSDRSLYRPGEILLLKAIVRDWTDAGLAIPNSLAGRLECLDARGRQFLQTNVDFSSLGAWDISVPLPLASRGSHAAKLQVGTQEFYYGFHVGDFQPSAFEIRLDAKTGYRPEEKIEIPLSARYFFGKSLSRARVKWTLQAADLSFQPERFSGFRFRRDEFEALLGRRQSTLTLTGQDMLMAGSNLLIRAEIPVNPVAPQPRSVTLLAEVTDQDQQTLSKSVEFVRHSSEFYLGLRPAGDVISAGRSLPVEAAAVGADGLPWSQPVRAMLKLARIDWISTRVQGAGRAVRYKNEAFLTNVLEREIEIQPATLPKRMDDEVKGFPVPGIIPATAGEYLLELSAFDPSGHPIVASAHFEVSAEEERRLGWNYRNEVQLALKPAQPEYLPGQTAEILVEAPISGTALVTVEREKVLRSFTVRLEGNAPVIKVPISSTDLPNIYVGVALIRGSEECPRKVKEPDYRNGYCLLRVVDPATRLAIEVSPRATNYLPGETVEVTVGVKDNAGAAVRDCELTVCAVDEGILSITENGLPDPCALFYATRPLAVQSHISLPSLLPEDPEELRFQNKGYFGGGGGNEAVRRKFLACAFWNAAMKTDSEGNAVARFRAPDSLTRYRVMAVAHTAKSQFGLGQSAFQVSKPLILEPALPQFANITDRLLARAVIQNQTTNSGDAIVTLALDSKARAGGSLTCRVALPPKGSALAEFPVDLAEVGTSTWIWKARFADPAAGNFTDAVQSSLDVGHVAPVLRQVLLARVTGTESNLLAAADPQIASGQGSVTVTIANSHISELQPSINHLLHYPYGCVEQTCSSLLPWIVVRANPGLRCLLQSTNDPDAAIRAGIHRLVSMQTESGGLTYWPGGGQPMLWASAYGGMVLALAKRQGAAVPQDDFNRLLKYLSEQLRRPDETGEIQARPLALYALALADRSEPAYHEQLYSARLKLSRENRALLALAILESKGSGPLARDLLKSGPATRSDEDAFGGPAREMAIRLLALTRCDPGAPIVDETVSDLMREQTTAHGSTTQGNAWALLALTEYARLVEPRVGATDARLVCGDQSIPFRLDQHTNAFTFVVPLTASTAPVISLLSPARQQLFATTVIETRSPSSRHPQEDHGFAIKRSYERLDDENQPAELKNLRVGDRVLVTIRVHVRQPSLYLVVDDALPSILEAMNPEFKTQGPGLPRVGRRASARFSPGFVGRWSPDEAFDFWPADFREIRKDRFLSFANYVEPGNYQLRYVARVRAAGTVTAPSAKVEEMYHPERYGLTETRTLASKPLESQ